MKCSYCGFKGPVKGIKYPAYTIITKGRTHYFCTLKCARSWMIRQNDLDNYHECGSCGECDEG